MLCYVITGICTVGDKFTLRKLAFMKILNVHDDLIRWSESVEFNSTSTYPETSAVNFETLFDELKYKTFHLQRSWLDYLSEWGRECMLYNLSSHNKL